MTKGNDDLMTTLYDIANPPKLEDVLFRGVVAGAKAERRQATKERYGRCMCGDVDCEDCWSYEEMHGSASEPDEREAHV